MTVELDFKDALRIDMERLGYSEATLGRALGITQQAVHKWVERGFPPLSRLDDLLAALGPGSEVSKLRRDKLYSSRSRTVVYTPNLPAANMPGAVAYRSAEAQALGLRERAQLLEMAVGGALPAALRVNMQRMIDVRGTLVRPDYLSDTVVAEIIYTRESVAARNTANALLALLTVAHAAPRARPVLFVVQEDGTVPRLPAMVSTAAAEFGVLVHTCASGEEVAHTLATLEQVPSTPEPDLLEPDE